MSLLKVDTIQGRSGTTISVASGHTLSGITQGITEYDLWRATANTSGNNTNITSWARPNGTLQGAYLMLAARAVGLDCGPMSGFNNAAVDEEFFGGTKLKSNFLCCLGYGDHKKISYRFPRLEFEEACKLI